MSPASGALSPTQLAVLEQIRMLRAAKPPVAVTTPVQAAPPLAAKPAVTALDRPAANYSAGNLSTGTLAATNPTQANRPRGSILNITV
jgi:hypothetical protein